MCVRLVITIDIPAGLMYDVMFHDTDRLTSNIPLYPFSMFKMLLKVA